jgi:hypothetical protein
VSPIGSPDVISTVGEIATTAPAVIPDVVASASEIAQQLLITEKNKLSNYFSSTKDIGNNIQNIRDISGFPQINSKITLNWTKGNPFL